MKRNRRLLAPLSFAVGLTFFAAGAAADDLGLSAELVDAGELATLRGGDAEVVIGDNASIDGIAVNVGDQTAVGFIGGAATSGSISFMENTFDTQRFNINAINTGNNVAMQNMMAVHVNMNGP